MNNPRPPEVRAKRASKGDGRDYKNKFFEARRKSDAHLRMTPTLLDK
jgi:hypothetical protein